MSEDIPSLSEAQLTANRANAKQSTGPQTLSGKLRSSQNAFKHGRYSGRSGSYLRSLGERMLELNEDPGEFAEIEDGLQASFRPRNEAQQTLVHEIALLQWQRRRLERAHAALVARRIQKLEIERERESLQVRRTISTNISTAQLKGGLIWDADSPTRFQKLLEWLEGLQGCLEAKNYETAPAVVDWIYGPVPTVRGALIKQLFRLLAAGPEAAPDESTVSDLRLELLREVADITAQYKLYVREHTEITPTMREECLAPNAKQRALMSQLSVTDRQIDQKVRLLLAVQKAAVTCVQATDKTGDSALRQTPQSRRKRDIAHCNTGAHP
ncbi:MAG: hypothetical protein ACRD3O_16830 [Terriglobia bacterium]